MSDREITTEEIKESFNYALEANTCFGLIKSGHFVPPVIEIIHLGPSLFGRKKDE